MEENKVPTQETVAEGTKWLLDLGMVNNDYIQNVILLNIYNATSMIKDVELLTDVYSKKVLVFLKLSWLGNRIFKKRVADLVLDMLSEGLPGFSIKIEYDKQSFEKSLEVAKKLAEKRTTFTRV